MARIRTIKPELFSSLSTKRLSLGARWLFAGLLCEADDDGRALASPRKIAGNIFPDEDGVSEKDVATWLAELEAAGRMIERYEVDGTRYLHIPKFRTHQRVSHPTPSRIPPPPEVLPKSSGASPEKLGSDSGEVPAVLRMDLGIGIGIEVEREVEGSLREAAEPQRPSLTGRTPRAQTIFGRVEVDSAPTTPKAILDDQHYGPILRTKFPALDGKGSRPTLLGEVTADFKSFSTKFLRDGRDGAFNGLISWISRRYGPHELSFKRNGGVDISAIVGRGGREDSS